MLTRSQVARRLGRSLATVRRLEGKELHPEHDARGVHRFDPDEVGALADRLMETGTLSAAGALDGQDEGPWASDSQRVEQLVADVDQLRHQLSEAQYRTRKANRELNQFKVRTAEVLGMLGRELMELDADLGDLVLMAMRELDS